MTANLKKITAFLLSIITMLSSFFGMLFPKQTEFINLMYGFSKAQRVDLYLPKTNSSACTGIVIYIHGGGWDGGDKDNYTAQCKNMASLGYAAASVNYRMLSDGATWEDMMDDITSAVERVKAKAAEKGIDLTKAAFTGGSAGGHLAMLYSFKNQAVSPLEIAFCASQCGPSDFTDQRLFDECFDPTWLYSLVSGLIDKELNKTTFGDLTQELQAASPVTYITKDSPPTIVAQGELDTVVRYSQGTDVYNAFSAAGGVCDLIMFPNSDHSLSSDPECSERYDKLFKEYMLKYFEY